MTKSIRRLPNLGVASTLVASALATYAAADKPATSASPAPKKPAWLTELSIGVKEGYDDNVYLVEVGPTQDLPSFVTTISPKIGLNLAPFLGDQKTLSVFSLGYAPDFNFFHDEPTETFYAHRVPMALKFKKQAWSVNVENAFSYIDGDEDGPIYLNGRSAFATAAARERREQYQDRAKASIQYDQEKWFVRPTATLLYYDLRTTQRLATGAWRGYDNYADRNDVNGGIDLGYKLAPKMALTLGYRYGHQYQEQYSAVIDPILLSSSSSYHRVLFGFEGKPWKWLTISYQGGPDFRSYDPNTPTHVTPMNDLDPVKYYGEAAVTADVTANDSLAFKYRQWQWLSSTGRIPLFDSLYDLAYKHKFGKKLTLDLGVRLQTSDYNSGNVASSLRDDWQYTFVAGLGYNFNAQFSAAMAYSVDLGRNMQDGLPAAVEEAREYEHRLISLGLLYKF
jgi:hypothetical protein